jgi:hypothetical protein
MVNMFSCKENGEREISQLTATLPVRTISIPKIAIVSAEIYLSEIKETSKKISLTFDDQKFPIPSPIEAKSSVFRRDHTSLIALE